MSPSQDRIICFTDFLITFSFFGYENVVKFYQIALKTIWIWFYMI